ncbi:MAG: hypothetical protein CFE35_13190 [Novosphingobium sp. PASSN1]|nr:MAG: hypothetical protein CFE35_13190 [Novosphingobium sp. PASSN1]
MVLGLAWFMRSCLPRRSKPKEIRLLVKPQLRQSGKGRQLMQDQRAVLLLPLGKLENQMITLSRSI